MRTAPFWVIMWSRIQPLKMGPIGLPVTSVINYHYLLCNPEERSSQVVPRFTGLIVLLKTHTTEYWILVNLVWVCVYVRMCKKKRGGGQRWRWKYFIIKCYDVYVCVILHTVCSGVFHTGP